MLFYRGINLLILSYEFYFLMLIKNNLAVESPVVDFIGIIGQSLILANLAVGALFFLLELILSRDSPTLASIKASYPYTETPIKIALLSTVGVSSWCGALDPNFYALQLFIRTDLVLSYLSYAWRTFWPVLIIPINKILMYINSTLLYIIRFIRGKIFYKKNRILYLN